MSFHNISDDDFDTEDINYPDIVPKPSAPYLSQDSEIDTDEEDFLSGEHDDQDDGDFFQLEPAAIQQQFELDPSQRQLEPPANKQQDEPITPPMRRLATRRSGSTFSMELRSASIARSRSQISTSSNHYRTNALIGAHFESVLLGNGNRKGNRCKYCKHLIKAHMTARAVDHLIFHCTAAPQSAKQELSQKLEETDQLALTERKGMNERFARIMVKHNIPLRLLSCELFRAFIKDYCRGRQLASRGVMIDTYISKIAHQTDRKFLEMVKRSRNYTLSIEFDHWTDMNHRSFLGVVVTVSDNSKHLLHLEDVSMIGHSSDAIVSSIKMALSDIAPKKINAIVSDNASNCVLARRNLVSTVFKHCIQHRCIAHWLNLIGSDVCKQQGARDVITESNRLANLLCNDSRILAKMNQAGARRCKRAVATRWYTTVTMFESLIDARTTALNIIQEEAANCPRDSKKSECLRLLKCDSLWPDIESMVKILRPLADCIAVSESRDGTIGRTIKSVLEFARTLFSLDWSEEYIMTAIESFLTYFSDEKLGDEMGVLLASYFLDRRNKMDYLTEKGQELVLEVIIRTASISGYKKKDVTTSLVDEFFCFCQQDKQFSALPKDEDESAEEWWLGMPETGVLRGVALRLAGLKSSSANVERVFSTLKYIQSPSRLRFSVKSLTNIAKIKVADFPGSEEIIDDEAADAVGASKQTRPRSNIIRQAMEFGARLLPSSQGSRSSQSQSNNANRRPNRFSNPGIEKSYRIFKELIDFDIVNEFTSNPGDLTVDEPEEIVIDQAMQRLRGLKDKR